MVSGEEALGAGRGWRGRLIDERSVDHLAGRGFGGPFFNSISDWIAT